MSKASDARIERLRAGPVPPTVSHAERLDHPLDPDIRVSGKAPRHQIKLLEDGTVVSWAEVVHFEQQIGGQALSMAGLAGVGTHPEHRFRGHARRLLENALRWMRHQGFGTSML